MAAPAVQNLQDIIASINAAQAPQNQAIDQSIASNDQSGSAQVAGLDAAKTNAFSQIDQGASNKGMLFSGFTPDAEAKYTGSTYLPALARLQSTIAATRTSLLGKKADLAAGANSAGLTEQHRQQGELDAYNNAQAQAAATEAAAERDAQTKLAVAGIGANATLGAAATRASSVAAKPVTGYGVVHVANNGGLQFHGPNGQPISAGAYLDAISGGNAGTKDLANLLAASNSANDQKLAKTIGTMSTAQAQKAYPWLFQ